MMEQKKRARSKEVSLWRKIGEDGTEKSENTGRESD